MNDQKRILTLRALVRQLGYALDDTASPVRGYMEARVEMTLELTATPAITAIEKARGEAHLAEFQAKLAREIAAAEEREATP